MFNLIHCAGNTYYLKCFSNIGVYYLGNDEVILIDGGDHKKSVGDLDAALCERGWKVKMLINTHCHLDHICGNRFFRDKYGCEIYSSDLEYYLIEASTLEPSFYYMGVPTNRERNFFFKPYGTKAKLLTDDILPEGFEIISLPGHSFNMIGIKTPDNVWFLGDAVLDEMTYEGYKLPFFHEVNNSIATMEMLKTLEGDWFVPSHTPAMQDITALADYNAEALRKIKDFYYDNCEGKTFQELFIDSCEKLGVDINNVDKFAKIEITIKAFLQALIEDGKLTAEIKDLKMIYHII